MCIRFNHKFSSYPMIILLFVNIVTSSIGIAQRTDSPFSVVWLTNAIVVGVLLRFYDHVNWRHYLVCCSGMILPDVLIGTDNIQLVSMTCANIITISVGYFFLHRYIKCMKTKWFSNLYCVPQMLLLCQPALILGSIVGSGTIAILYKKAFLLTTSYWYLNESLNFIILLPIVLTMPLTYNSFKHSVRLNIAHILPTFSLFCILILTKDKVNFLMILIFIMPAAVWLALSGELFLTTLSNGINSMFIFLWLIHSSHEYIYFNEYTYLSIIRVIITSMALCALMIAVAISERDKLFEQLSFTSNHDDLTGVLNRRAFIKTAEATIVSLKKNDICTMVLIDIDFFKKINDMFGHQTGDQVLIEFCYQLKKLLPANHLLGRIGGEEFALLFSNTPEKNHQKLVDHIVNHFPKNPLIINGASYLLTISVGIVECSVGEQYETLFKYADQALYLAKRNGRNQWQKHQKNDSFNLFSNDSCRDGTIHKHG